VIQALAGYQIVAGAQAKLHLWPVQAQPRIPILPPDGWRRRRRPYPIGKLDCHIHRHLKGSNITVA